VRPEQIEAVSWGEEKPRSTGHDEKAWSENRRSDFAGR
jgi:peptidoglycan-associated lipoprotein